MQLLKIIVPPPRPAQGALTLCKTYEFHEGFVFICEKTGQFQLLMSYFMDSGDVPKLLSVCEKFAGRDPGLWEQALHYLSSQGGKGEHIKEVLQHIEANDLVPPLIILDSLKVKF